MTVAALVVLGLFALTPPALAQCGGGEGGAPTLKTIAVDGNASDWANVLSNPLQLTNDGQFSANCDITPLDRDCSPGKNVTGRDLARFAWTYDGAYIFVYQTRFGSASNTQAFYFYMDTNSNQRMNTGEKVFQIRYSGQTRRTDGYLYTYTAVGGAGGDAMVNGSGFADGYTMPGTIGTEVLLYSSVTGGFADGSGFEGRVAWTSLGIPAGTAVYFHVSSCNNSNPGQVPSSIDDSLGGPGGGLGAFAFLLVSVAPNRSSTVPPGSPTTVDYLHTVTNAGTLSDRYDFEAASSAGFQVDLYDDGTNTWMGTDLQGDGVWDSVNAAYDNPSADGRPNTPSLSPSGTFAVRVHLTAPAGTQNALDTMVLRLISQGNPICVKDTATDTTAVGALTLQPTPQSKAGVPGQVANFGLTLANYSIADTFNLTPVSSAGYRVTLYTDPNGDGDPADGVVVATDLNGNGVFSDAGDSIAGGFDTDADGKPDFGAMAYGASRTFVAQLSLPIGAAIGSVSTVSLQALGAVNGAIATASLTTTARSRLTLTPNYTIAAGTNKYSGQNRSTFFAHRVVNGWPTADTVSLAAGSTRGWTVRLYTDPDGDGNPNDGEPISGSVILSANGGTLTFVVEVVIPSGLTLPLTDTTTVTATSELSPSTSVAVIDQVRVSYLAVYADVNHTISSTYFVRCDTVYALGSSLVPNTVNRYRVVYIDPDTITRRDVLLISDGNGDAPDEYLLSPTDVRGIWTLQLWDGAVGVDTLPIIVDPAGTPSTIQPVLLNQASYALSGDTLTVTPSFNNTSAGGTYTETTYQYLFLNPAGDRYLTPTGSFAAYTPGDFTRVTSPHSVDPSSSATESISIPSVSFDGPGVYNLVVSWVGPCGNTIASAALAFPVGTALASYSDPAFTVPSDSFGASATIYLAGSNYLPSTAYTVAYYDPSGNLVTTQSATSTAGGALSTGILVSLLGLEGGWTAVVYPATTAPLATYSPGFAGALSEDVFSLDTTPPAVPVVVAPSDGSTTNDSTPEITGTAEPGSTVAIFIDGVLVGAAVADGSGNWSYTSAALADGTYEVTATATDPVGNTSAASSVTTFTVTVLRLLRYGGVTQLAPQNPANSAIFVAQYPVDPSLDVVRDLEVTDFASGAAFPNEVNDLGGASPPLVFYQVAGKAGSTLRVTLSGGKIVITH